MTSLQPCPFCGSNDIYHDAFGSAFGCCAKCDASGPIGRDGEWVESWNTRVPPWRSLKDDPPELVAKPWYRLVLLRDDDTPRSFGFENAKSAVLRACQPNCDMTEWMEIPE